MTSGSDFPPEIGDLMSDPNEEIFLRAALKKLEDSADHEDNDGAGPIWIRPGFDGLSIKCGKDSVFDEVHA